MGAEPVVCAREVARCAGEFLRRMRAEAERAFIVREGLGARPVEIQALRAYDVAFRAHDRSQRARKLVELQGRLADPRLDPSERARLESFRAVLVRLAGYEADVDAGLEPADEPDPAVLAQWVERFKVDAALYERYGGVVGIEASGPYAHGARAALVEDHMRTRPVAFLDAGFEAAVRRALASPPVLAATDAPPDFTPFWLRPIPASYVPD